MTDKSKAQLTDDQRQQLKSAVVATAGDMLRRRKELQDQARTARQLWEALVKSPTWVIAHVEKPDDELAIDENWSVIPTVNKK